MKNDLHSIAKALMSTGKGILAADESTGTSTKRFDAIGLAPTEENRQRWRDLLLTAPGVAKGLSGIILYDETIRQGTLDGDIPFAEYLSSAGIIPGIKVDKGTKPIPESPDEVVTEGLDGLAERLKEYVTLGAKFTKWRAVIRIGEGMPSKRCLAENAKRLAEYAILCQRAGLVPILEPEVLLDGTHSLKKCKEVLVATLKVVFAETKKAGVDLQGLLLKTSMALPGKDSGEQASAASVAEATVSALLASVPQEVAGVVFLSGGQTSLEATERLNEIARYATLQNAPWPLTFSYSRAIQDPVLKRWAGADKNRSAAQEIFKKRVLANAAASRGEWSPQTE